MKIVRERMGLRNVELLVPFVRTVEEGRHVVELMGELGLARGTGPDCVKVYFMCEVRAAPRQAGAQEEDEESGAVQQVSLSAEEHRCSHSEKYSAGASAWKSDL